MYSKTTDVIYEERRSDWSCQVSVMATTRWLQRDQTLPLSAKGVACETMDWTGGLDWWTGPVHWTGGLDWWTDTKNELSNEAHSPME